MLDIKIIGGTIIDGTGARRYKGDVGVEGDKIVAIGDLKDVEAKKVIDATGKYVTPGFIDMHTHSDFSLTVSRDASVRIHDGVTTDVIGNCGIGIAPVSDAHKADLITYLGTRLVASIPVEIKLPWSTMDEYFKFLEENNPAVNVAPLAAQGAIRIHEMGFAKGKPTAEQMANMKAELKKAMDAGCVGMSSGLVYMPGEYSNAEEIGELCSVMQEYDGFYVTHMRSEGAQIWEAIEEAIEIAKRGGVRLAISHLKLLGNDVWNQTDRLFARLDKARSEVKELAYDAYPYDAGCTSLGALLPPWVFEGGAAKMLERIKDPEIRVKMRHDMENGLPGWQNFWKCAGGWAGFPIATVNNKESEWVMGQTVQALADQAGKDPFEWAFDFLSHENGRVQVILMGMKDEDVQTILARPETMVGSDSMSLAETGILGTGMPHPRAFGTHARFLGKYVRDEGGCSLETAIEKMTGRSAKHLRLDRRGEIKEGYYADIVVMDYVNVKDNATYMDPKHYSTGFDYVVVNGKVALDNGVETKDYAGRVLRHGK
ncbi:MAG: D-aminoacylase [Phascolarctobacterium sp.]|nr:D-aminoacylase [Phascolarctobacterium sp.]